MAHREDVQFPSGDERISARRYRPCDTGADGDAPLLAFLGKHLKTGS